MNENPTVFDFIKNTQALRGYGNLAREVKGNCRGTKSLKRALDIEDLAPIAKRRTDAERIMNLIFNNNCQLYAYIF